MWRDIKPMIPFIIGYLVLLAIMWVIIIFIGLPWLVDYIKELAE